MKKFTLTVLCTAIFFLGLGGLLERAGARFKSDEKALTLIRQARQAVGGDANINNVRSFSATGKISKTFNLEGAPRVEQGDWELNLQLPNQMSRLMRLGKTDGTGEGQERIEKNVVIIKKGEDEKLLMSEAANGGDKKVFVIKKDDAPTVAPSNQTNGEAKKITVDKDVRVIAGGAEKSYQTDLFRTTLALLLTAPENADVSYIYAGEETVDGAACEIVEARSGDSSVKLYLDKSSHLPKMIAFQAAKPLIMRFKTADANPNGDQPPKVLVKTSTVTETGEFQIKFSDYRTAGGVLLPHKWTQTVGGNADETIDVTSYEINPANIAEKFKNEPQKIMLRTKKPE